MKTKHTQYLLAALVSVAFATELPAQGTAFTYQGRLNDGGNPADGTYDLRFILWNADIGGSQQGSVFTTNGVAVSHGLFVVTLDFGANFPGADRWLEIDARTNGAASFVPLNPRQKLAPTPYAITAGNVVSGGLPATYSSAVNFNNGGNSFTGGGGGLTSLNASSLASGTVPDARLGANVARTSQVWLLGGNSVANGQFIGSLNNQPVEIRADGLRALRLEALPNDAIHTNIVNVIGGSAGNAVRSGVFGATIAGGGATVDYYYGLTNSVTGNFGTVSGGEWVTATNFAAAGGGYQITASGSYSAVGGGIGNVASGDSATVCGGEYNTAKGEGAIAAGGGANLATGAFSFAAGSTADATNDASFVWADGSQLFFGSLTNDTFNVCAKNGVRIQSDKGIHLDAADRPLIVRDWDRFAANAPAGKAGIGRWGLFMEPNYLTLGIPNVAGRYFQVAKYSTNGTYATLVSVDQAGNLRATGNVYAHGVELTSDRNAKENFTALDGKSVLAKVMSLPVTEWNYKTDSSKQKHIGPMAQDFHAAFDLNGQDDKHISVIDEGGVALAAIQGLNDKVEVRSRKSEGQIGELKTENTNLRTQVADLRSQLDRLQKAVARLAAKSRGSLALNTQVQDEK